MIKNLLLVGGSVGLGIAGGSYLDKKAGENLDFVKGLSAGSRAAFKGGTQAITATVIYGVARSVAR